MVAVVVLIRLGITVRIGLITVGNVVIIRIVINVRTLGVIIRVIGVLHGKRIVIWDEWLGELSWLGRMLVCVAFQQYHFLLFID
jgi:hypothetical protein